MLCKAKSAKKKKTARRFLTIFKHKWSNVRPLLSTTFPQGFRISKNIGHQTLGNGCKKTFKPYLKSEHTDGRTHRQADTQTDRRTFGLLESVGPEGQCFEKISCVTLFPRLYPRNIETIIQTLATGLRYYNIDTGNKTVPYNPDAG